MVHAAEQVRAQSIVERQDRRVIPTSMTDGA
jgi:hypothetical protein